MWRNRCDNKFGLQFLCPASDLEKLEAGAGHSICSKTSSAVGKLWWLCVKKFSGQIDNVDTEFIALFLYARLLDGPKVQARYKLRIVANSNENNIEKSIESHVFHEGDNQFTADQIAVVSSSHLTADEPGFCYNNQFRFEADVTILSIDGVEVNFFITPMLTFCENPSGSGSIAAAKPTPLPYDIILVSKCGVEFACHTYILATNQVFERVYFKSEEDTEGPSPGIKIIGKPRRVVLQDISADVLRVVLSHIYHGSLEFDVSIAGGVLHAAETHNLPSLKRKCEADMAQNLKTDNFVEYLLMCELTNSTSLKETCIEFWREHGKEVMKLKEWRKFVTDAAKDSKNQTLIDTLFIGLFDDRKKEEK